MKKKTNVYHLMSSQDVRNPPNARNQNENKTLVYQLMSSRKVRNAPNAMNLNESSTVAYQLMGSQDISNPPNARNRNAKLTCGINFIKHVTYRQRNLIFTIPTFLATLDRHRHDGIDNGSDGIVRTKTLSRCRYHPCCIIILKGRCRCTIEP